MSRYCVRWVLNKRAFNTFIQSDKSHLRSPTCCQACILHRHNSQLPWLLKGGSPRQTYCSSSSDTTTDKTDKTPNKTEGPAIVVKVQHTKKRPKIDFSLSYTENVYITPVRAMAEYLIDAKDLEGLPKSTRRSPYRGETGITVYRRHDVEKRAISRWGSLEKLQKLKDKLRAMEFHRQAGLSHVSCVSELYYMDRAKKEFIKGDSPQPSSADHVIDGTRETIFKSGPGKVILYAILINGVNTVFKFGAWSYTGSHSLFAECIHSLADTVNQIILAYGVHKSLKEPDSQHPYGWASFRNVASLISGVGIFCVGAGLSWYHGIMGLLHAAPLDSLYWAVAVLAGAFVSEGATLMIAVNQIRTSAKKENVTFWDYVVTGRDPSTNVVLMEDLAAVIGVTIAASCMSLNSFYSLADPIGSLIIGSLLGGVASFIIYTNTIALVGKSIPQMKQLALMRELESDRMIRALHDVKATDMGGSHVRFKAEVDFDGREITRYYLEKQDLELLLADMHMCSSVEDVEQFFLKHGESIVDTLGGEVDRIERNLKNKHPELRHVDLEQL